MMRVGRCRWHQSVECSVMVGRHRRHQVIRHPGRSQRNPSVGLCGSAQRRQRVQPGGMVRSRGSGDVVREVGVGRSGRGWRSA